MARHLLRRRGDGNGGLLKKCLTQPRLFAGADDLEVQSLDDRSRRAGRRCDTPPVGHVVARLGTATADAATGAWSFPLGLLADGSTHSYTVTATDAAGNVSQPSDALSFVVDTTAPTVTVSIDNTRINVAHPTATVTFTFSESPTDFTLNDVTSADGSLSNLSGSGTTYTATVTANSRG